MFFVHKAETLPFWLVVVAFRRLVPAVGAKNIRYTEQWPVCK